MINAVQLLMRAIRKADRASWSMRLRRCTFDTTHRFGRRWIAVLYFDRHGALLRVRVWGPFDTKAQAKLYRKGLLARHRTIFDRNRERIREKKERSPILWRFA